MKRIVDLLRASKVPLMIYMNQKEVASSAKVTLNAFIDAANDYKVVTNIADPKSPTDAKAKLQKIEGFAESVDTASFTASDDMQRMRDSEGNDVYMDVELAFDLSTLEIVSPLTGNMVTISYPEVAEDEEEEMEETMDSEDDSGEEEESEEESMDEEVDESSEEEEIETVSSAEDIPAEGDEEESMDSEEEIDETLDEEMEEPEEEADVEDVKTIDMEVSMVDMVDTTKTIRLVNLNADKTEIAVFVGGTPIGQLTRGQAAETASFLYDDGSKLFHTFKDRFAQLAKTKGNFGELASLGFVPYTATAKVSSIVDSYIAQEVAAIRKEIAAERSTGTERHKRVVSLAMVGICKGLFDKSSNPLVREVASLLRQSGHLSPEIAARRVLTNTAGEFTKLVFERADDLASKDDAYLNGIQDTVKSADFKAADEETTEKLGNVTTLFSGNQNENASDGFVDSFAPKKTANRFDRLVAGIGNRNRR